MTRSYLRTPILGCCLAHSEQSYKHERVSHERAKIRDLLAHGQYDEAMFEQVPWDEWDTNRDGKRWFGWSYFPDKKSRSK